ncbi:glycosyltransferase 25 family member [Phlebotomus argentipes]|uniref:glycosyltransferase 25 family member n=1 Tax=Phlebotomus argentipes TaxID=94469 RepID=UPI00289319D3|nr:glycosyltransferase 25 family member [Phlebotomus argentipes]
MNLWQLSVLMCLAVSGIQCQLARKEPKLLIVTLVRNKAHTLPLFLTYLTQLQYPKDRIALWIRSDHNADASLEIVGEWLAEVKSQYHSVQYQFNDSATLRPEEQSATHWPLERFQDVIAMKEEGLRVAREIWADYVLFLDADAFLTHPNTLRDLMAVGVPIVAPMLISDGLYSNYWCGMTEDHYYERTEEYKKILNREMEGVFAVPMVHSAVLINLNHPDSDLLTFDKNVLNFHLESLNAPRRYDGPVDDIIIFAMSANYSGIPMMISNTEHFGYILSPLEQDEELRRDLEQLTNIRMMIWNDLERLDVLPRLAQFVTEPKKDRLTLSKIFMVNLKRRPERRAKMEGNFRELGLDVEYFEAVDGKMIDEDFLESWQIDFLPEYFDPYHKRPMTMGEVGCFLSHFTIWRRMVEEEELQEVLILEDDIRFEPFFRERLVSLLDEAHRRGAWDLIYLGRKRLHDASEHWVEDSQQLVFPSYSYWTLGYLISRRGAQKLLAARPLEKLVPVDEFLPIMFDRHPSDEWKSAFSPRNLVAMSAAPLLLYPTHYTGEHGYISDTEDSIQIPLSAGEASDVPRKSDKADQALEMDALSPSLLDNAINDRWTTKDDRSDL